MKIFLPFCIFPLFLYRKQFHYIKNFDQMESDEKKITEDVSVEINPSENDVKIRIKEEDGQEESFNIHTSEKIEKIDVVETKGGEKIKLTTEDDSIDIDIHDRGHHKPVDITVMVNKKPVEFHEKEATGAAVKREAINQGVDIKPDFNLFEKEKSGELKPVADEETVKLYEGKEFRAVAPDDNSGK
jgi:hypothetical protein